MTTPQLVRNHPVDVEGNLVADDWKRWLCVGLLLALALIAAAILSSL
jgi:hypothetical protein